MKHFLQIKQDMYRIDKVFENFDMEYTQVEFCKIDKFGEVQELYTIHTEVGIISPAQCVHEYIQDNPQKVNAQ